MAKNKQGASPFYETPGGILTPVQGFSNSAGFGTPPKPARRGEPKEPGTGRVPSGGTSGREAGTALGQAFGFKKGGRK